MSPISSQPIGQRLMIPPMTGKGAEPMGFSLCVGTADGEAPADQEQ